MDYASVMRKLHSYFINSANDEQREKVEELVIEIENLPDPLKSVFRLENVNPLPDEIVAKFKKLQTEIECADSRSEE